MVTLCMILARSIYGDNIPELVVTGAVIAGVLLDAFIVIKLKEFYA